jgi:hypothetical protein
MIVHPCSNIFPKIRRRSGRAGESERVSRGRPRKPYKWNQMFTAKPLSKTLPWERKPVMWPACLVGFHEQIYDPLASSGWFFRIKRHCCPTWVPPKINMEFARVSRKYTFISRRMNGRFRLKEIRSTATHIRTYWHSVSHIWHSDSIWTYILTFYLA